MSWLKEQLRLATAECRHWPSWMKRTKKDILLSKTDETGHCINCGKKLRRKDA